MERAMRRLEDIAALRFVVRPRDLTPVGLSKGWLDTFTAGSELRKVGPGLYVLAGQCPDSLALVGRRYRDLTIGLRTALWLHGLWAQRPTEDEWVLGIHDWAPRWWPHPIKLFRSSWAREDQLLWRVQNVVQAVHTPLHAVLDCVRFRRRLEPGAAEKAVQQSLAAGAFTTEALLARGRAMRLGGPVNTILNRLTRPRA